MKRQIRVIGIDDASFDKYKDTEVLVIGTVFRGGDFMDGLVSTRVKRDGDDATGKIIEMIKGTKFLPQLQAVMLDGIAVAGFNVIDIERLYDETGLPVIVVIRKDPDVGTIKATLAKLGMGDKVALIERAGPVRKVGRLYVQQKGLEEDELKELLRITCTHANVPEPIRMAHIIGSGISLGESRGNA